MCFVGFNSVPNLIVNLFNLLYPVFIVGFNYKGCLIERECEDSSYWRLKRFSRVAYDLASHEMMHVPCMWLECEESVQMETTVLREYLAGKAFPQDTRETFCFARLCYLIYTFCTHTIYTHITNKCWGVLQRKNPNHKPWELETVIPTILYTIACGFSSTPTSSFPYHWEVDNPNIYHTLSECQVIFWCCWEVLEEANDGKCNMVLVARSRELDKTRFREALLE